MQTKALLASLLLTASAMAAPTELRTRQSNCSALQLVYLPGTKYVTTVQAGAKLTADYITKQAASCPSQVFVLAGYSKGAMVVHTTSLTTALKAKVVGISVFGDPYRSSSNAWPIPSPSVDSAPRDGSTASQNVASFCNSGDLFCDGGSSLPAHLAYGTDGSTTVAATFLKNKYTARA
ncbi:hypothetical protein FRC07_004764 [Ceratobasidium sp. 392]|nr:hypothetical protein FRC07_004764 [Ceratobasidium sp. 392]